MKISITLSLLALSLTIYGQQELKSIQKLPDTGQESIFSTYSTEDGAYKYNSPLLIDNLDGTITDSVTGLMWQKGDSGELSYAQAILYCNNLSLAGYDDWRLPTALEAYTLMNLQYLNPALDLTYFPNTGAEYWWTSDRQANDTTKIWSTNSGGGIGNHKKTETISSGGTKKFHVRAVRDRYAPTALNSRFTDNLDGTITDEVTGLIWMAQPTSDSITWENALNYADTLNFAGYNDWRVPNIKEIQSIQDVKRIKPALNTSFFKGISTYKYWTSTSIINQATKAWYIDFQYGITTYALKTARLKTFFVRNKEEKQAEISKLDLITLYPTNPFSDKINIVTSESCELIDSFGKTVYKGNSIHTQNFENLNKGIYFLRIHLTTYKLIKN